MIIHTLVPYLIGAATTLVVQMIIQYVVVPRVEARKRRESRWESNLDSFTELLTSDVSKLAYDARFEQSFYRSLRAKSSDPRFDAERVAQGLREQERKARAATYAFMDLLRTRYLLIFRRIAMPESPDTADFTFAALRYHMTALGLGGWQADDGQTDDAFEQMWDAESQKRYEVIEKATQLAELSRPLRRARFKAMLRFLRRGPKRVRAWAGTKLSRTSPSGS